MPFTAKTDHPLNWGDREIAWLLSTDMNPTNIYRAMGYRSDRPSASFLKRLELVEKKHADTIKSWKRLRTKKLTATLQEKAPEHE